MSKLTPIAWFPRIVLIVVGAALVLVGLRLGLSPEETGLAPESAAAASNLRVAFGGFHAGVGAFALLCANNGAFVRPGLVALFLISIGVLGFRLYGLAVDGASAGNLAVFWREIASGALIFAAFAVAQRRTRP